MRELPSTDEMLRESDVRPEIPAIVSSTRTACVVTSEPNSIARKNRNF
jgi:hypothetical protein